MHTPIDVVAPSVQVPPSNTHLPPKQQPLLQLSPAQQASPGLPHLAQVLRPAAVRQTLSATHAASPYSPGQQGSANPPHFTQVVPREHAAPWLHEDAQQGWLMAPQVEHSPFEHVPPL